MDEISDKVVSYLMSRPEVFFPGSDHSAWSQKAFGVMYLIQPQLELSDVFLICWKFPNVQTVIAEEGVYIWQVGTN